MISTNLVTANPFVEDLKQQLSRNELNELDYVFVAHADDRMIEKLKYIFIKHSIAVIAIPQSAWNMGEQPVDELLSWCMNDLNVKGVFLVGHSQGGTPEKSVQVCCSAGESKESINIHTVKSMSLLDRVKKAQDCVRDNEKHFTTALSQLMDRPSIQSTTQRNREWIQGLFYRAESGLFCIYDQESGEMCLLQQAF